MVSGVDEEWGEGVERAKPLDQQDAHLRRTSQVVIFNKSIGERFFH